MQQRRAAIYARFSTDLQSERSITDQVALCRTHAAREGLTVTATFSDSAQTSATLIGRDGIMAALTAAQAGEFDVLLVEALDRISRDQADLAGIFKRLHFAGVDILAVHDGRADAVQVGLRGLMGELFLADLKHKVRRGMSGVIRDGRHAGGRAYGYRPRPGQPGELDIDQAEAEVVRRIFADYAAGIPGRSIAHALNAEGIMPPRGIRWRTNTLTGHPARGYGILRNDLYQGQLVWGRVRMVRHPDTGRRISRTVPAEEWQRAEAAHLRIIDADTWDQVQARLESQSRQPSGRRGRVPRRPFSGLLRCGKCGGGMGIYQRRGDSVWIRCETMAQSGSCSNTSRPRLDRIEAALFDRLQAELAKPGFLQLFLDAYQEERRKLAAATPGGQKEAAGKAAEAARQLSRAEDLYIRGLADGQEALDRLQRLKAEAAEAEALVARLARRTAPMQLQPAKARRHLANLAGIAAAPDLASPDALAQLRQLVAEVRITPTAEGQDVLVTGHLAELVECREAMVAEEGLEPPTRGL